MAPLVKNEYEMSGIVANATRNPNALSHASALMLVALPIERQIILADFTETCAPELASDGIPFIAIGSGQPLADPFLAFARRVLWPANGSPSLAEGRLTAVWALRHAIETNTGGVAPPIQIVQLTKDDGECTARELPEAEVQQQEEACRDLEQYISKWPRQFSSNPAATAPPPPPT